MTEPNDLVSEQKILFTKKSQVSGENTEKVEFIKADSNRRIKEMERLCNEKLESYNAYVD